MSFFCDVYNEFGLSDFNQNISINYIENKGLIIVGKFKVLTLNESLINLKSNKNLIEIKGENLYIKTISKGELVVIGKIFSINFGGKNE